MKPSKIKSRPLRNPGQSLDEEIERVVFDDFLGYFLFAGLFWLIAGLEWVGKYFHVARAPGTYAIIAGIATALCVLQFRRTRKEVRKLKQGRDGERDVAEILDDLKRHGAQVLHDIPGEKGNVDHVVICTRGIFVIETKAWSKPENAWEMDFDGDRILIPNRAPENGPIIQCKAESASIKALLKESTSKVFPVRGVVVFLDWFVKRSPAARGSDIWVLNPKELAGWVRREQECLSEADVAMATLHLKQYVKKLAA